MGKSGVMVVIPAYLRIKCREAKLNMEVIMMKV